MNVWENIRATNTVCWIRFDMFKNVFHASTNVCLDFRTILMVRYERCHPATGYVVAIKTFYESLTSVFYIYLLIALHISWLVFKYIIECCFMVFLVCYLDCGQYGNYVKCLLLYVFKPNVYMCTCEVKPKLSTTTYKCVW